MGVEAGKGEAIPDDVRIEVGSVVILRETRADETGDEESRGLFEVSSAQPRVPGKRVSGRPCASCAGNP